MKKETSENKKERTNENTIIIVQSYMEGDKERLSGNPNQNPIYQRREVNDKQMENILQCV